MIVNDILIETEGLGRVCKILRKFTAKLGKEIG